MFDLVVFVVVSKTAAAAVVFVPSITGSILIKRLEENEEKMAEITGFKIKFQEAGGSKLVNCFEKVNIELL